MSQIPYDDLELEMEEVEGLVAVNSNQSSSSTVGSKTTSSGPSSASAATAKIMSTVSEVLSSGGNRNKFLSLALLIAVLFFMVLSEGELDVTDGTGIADVEGKEPISVEYFDAEQPNKVDKTPDPGAIVVNPPEGEPKNQPDNSGNKETDVTEKDKANEPEKVKEDEPKEKEKDEPKKEETPDENKDKTSDENKDSKTAEASKKDKSEDNEKEKPDDSNNENKQIEDNKNEEKTPDETDKSEETNKAADAEAKKEELIAKYGKWGFWDGAEEIRPKEDYCAKYPNRDIPEVDFPDTAWQADAVYANHWLDAAANLVTRAMEAIYEEYGHKKEGLDSAGRIERAKMFHIHMADFEKEGLPPKEVLEGGGWMTRKSFEGLVRRLLHAMMTNDTFTVVMGGHSAAAGHGNHFHQSYMMQFHKIMDPIFARLGVKLITRNIGQGGLGTLQGALGSGSIYGDEVDMIVWDSSMTEKSAAHIDLFERQALLGGKRAPFLWGGNADVMRALHENADADVGIFGNGNVGIPMTMDEEQVKTLPWAAQYLICDKQREELCKDANNRFRTKCWIDRPDVTPATKQRDHSKSQVGWHPGFRRHQLTGRVLAFTVLEALQDAINTWSEVTITGGHPLPDEYWHISDYYRNIQEKTRNLDASVGNCHQTNGDFPERVCSTALNARTEFTPRADPEKTSITSIIKPTSDGYIPQNEEELMYEGPDVPNPALDPPEGEVDVLAIVSNRRMLKNFEWIEDISSSDQIHYREEYFTAIENKTLAHHNSSMLRGRAAPLPQPSFSKSANVSRKLEDSFVSGKGWEVQGVPPGYCDGTYSAICGRQKSSDCLLSGHMDARGGILGNEYSGWLVMDIKDVKEGIIIIKIETWHKPEESTKTKGWSEVNNGERYLEGHTVAGDAEKYSYNDHVKQRRRLDLPDSFFFDFSIDGKVTSWNKDEFLKNQKVPQRVVELWTLLDDPEMAKKGESKDVELAIRMRGCSRDCTFKLTHVYWA